MVRAGEATVVFGADDSELGAAAGRVRQTLDGMRDQMEKVGRVARNMLLIGGGALAGFIKAASDAQESLNKFEQVFGDQADAAEEFADRLGAAIGRSSREIRAALSTFQSFFVGMGFGGQEAQQLSEQITALAADFASFHNLSDDEAVERFISALSGSSEVLDRFGVNIKQAALEKELLRQGFEGTVAAAGEEEKALARLNVIMQAMTDQGAIGDAERTAGDLANQMKALRGEAIDVATAIGQTVLPAVTKLLKEVREIVPVVQKWIAENGDLIPTITAWSAVTLGVLFVLPKVVAAVAATKAAVAGLTAAYGALNLAMTAAIAKFALIGGAVAAAATIGVIIGRVILLGESFGEAGMAVLRFFDMFTGGALFSVLDSLGLIDQKLMKLKGNLTDTNDAIREVTAAERELAEAQEGGSVRDQIDALTRLRSAQRQQIEAEKAHRRQRMDAGLSVTSEEGFGKLQAHRRDQVRQTEVALRDLQKQANQTGGEMMAAFRRGEMSADDLKAALQDAAEASRQFTQGDDPRQRVRQQAQELIDAEREAAQRVQQAQELSEAERVRLVEESSQRIIAIREREAEQLEEIAQRETEAQRKEREQAVEGFRRVQMFLADDAGKARLRIQQEAESIEQDLINSFREGLITRRELVEGHAALEAEAQQKLSEQLNQQRQADQFQVARGGEELHQNLQRSLFAGTADAERQMARMAERQVHEQQHGNRLLGKIEAVLARMEAREGGSFPGVFGGT